MSNKESGNIKVFCRFRPFNARELEQNSVKMHRIAKQKQLIIRGLRDDEISFMYDHVFDTHATQDAVYEQVGKPVLTNILDGFNGTIMAYGQTSSGKTHTMQGYDLGDKSLKGIMPRIIEDLFSWIEKSPEYVEYKLKISICQLYLQKVRDLLDVSKADLRIREGKQGPYVEDLTEVYVGDKIQLFKLIQMGQKNRMVCSTNMNESSSRSHMIFLLSLNQFNTVDSSSKTSKLFLIDLAGSEKISKTGAEGKLLQEAKKINLSLTCLGKVIKALAERDVKGSHIPYRDSKLTRIIKDSLGGNSKTTLIVTCSPHEMHLPETISTLRFGENAQKIKNKPKINRQLTVQQLQKIVEKLEHQISDNKQRIKVLQTYITDQLKAELPKRALKVTQSNPKQNQIEGDLQTESQLCRLENEVNNAEQEQQKVDERVAMLQQQVASYQKKMQKQLKKFDNLKREYGQMHENMKQLLRENIELQEKLQAEREVNSERILDEEQKLKRDMSAMEIKQVQVLKLALGNIFGVLGQQMEKRVKDELKNEFWYRKLVVDGEECTEFWKREKEEVDRQMSELTASFINLNTMKRSRCDDNISISSKSRAYSIDVEGFPPTSSGVSLPINPEVSLPINPENRQPNLDQLPTQRTNPSVRTHQIQTQEIVEIEQTNKEQINLEQRREEDAMNFQRLLEQHQRQILQRQNMKLMRLESKLDKLYEEYHEMIMMQTTWKVECQLYERKLKQKEQKIGKLQQMLNELTQKLQMMEDDRDDRDTMSIKTKIVKPLKGGFIYRH